MSQENGEPSSDDVTACVAPGYEPEPAIDPVQPGEVASSAEAEDPAPPTPLTVDPDRSCLPPDPDANLASCRVLLEDPELRRKLDLVSLETCARPEESNSSPVDPQAVTAEPQPETVFRVYAKGRQIYKKVNGTWDPKPTPVAALFSDERHEHLIGQHEIVALESDSNQKSAAGPIWRLYETSTILPDSYVMGHLPGKTPFPSPNPDSIDELRIPALMSAGSLQPVRLIGRLFTKGGKLFDSNDPRAASLTEYPSDYTCEYYFVF